MDFTGTLESSDDVAVHPEEEAAATEARRLEALIARITTIRDHALEEEKVHEAWVAAVHPEFRESVRNLLHYLALRSFDVRELQEQLAPLGLTSLGRTEAHVMASLNSVLRLLHRLAGHDDPGIAVSPADFERGSELLAAHTLALLGERNGTGVRIMVTLASDAAEDYPLVRDLILAGVDCVRINCAHDDEGVWSRMIENVRQARRETQRPCRIAMDVAGPKVRTGPLAPAARVISWRPHRNARGWPTAPALVLLLPVGSEPPAGTRFDTALPVQPEWLEPVRVGDRIRFRDTRGKKRRLRVVQEIGACRLAEGYETAYVETGTTLKTRRPKSGGTVCPVGALPPVDEPLVLNVGETLILDRDPLPGRPAVRDERGTVQEPARISCTLPGVFADVHVGEPVKFDDGKIEGVIRSVSTDALHVEITHARLGGSKLRGDRSINFPESTLRLEGLTEKDLRDLDFIARHADVVGLSYAETPEDVTRLQEELAKRDATRVGILLKIETERGFRQLPRLLMAAMRSHPAGVMIARGDLAVESGWERLAELQEEILWLCEAAHVPVVWATQVLERLTKSGLPTRAEITDAAMAERAECVMLNKGPYILEAVRILNDILRRMETHQLKKTAMLRRLQVAGMP